MKGDEASDICEVMVGQDGSVGLLARTNYMEGGPYLDSKWIMADVANALRIASGVRGKTGPADTQFSLVLGIGYVGGDATPAGVWKLGLLPDENPTQGTPMPPKPLDLGPYPVGPASDFPSILRKVLADLYMAAGKPPEDEFIFDELPPLAD